jgi:hypothetical protein
MEIILASLLVILIIAVVITYSVFSWGVVLYKFWYWFLIPVFTGLPEISYYAAVGLVFVVSLFKTTMPSLKKEVTDTKVTTINFFINPWIVLLIGYLVYLFIK